MKAMSLNESDLLNLLLCVEWAARGHAEQNLVSDFLFEMRDKLDALREEMVEKEIRHAYISLGV